MNSYERANLEAKLALSATFEPATANVIVHTPSTAEAFIKNLVDIDIPTWKSSEEMDRKRTYFLGLVTGWATAGLIDAVKLDEYQRRISLALNTRIKELLV